MLPRKFAGASALLGEPSDHFVSSPHVPPPVAVHCDVMSGPMPTVRVAYAAVDDDVAIGEKVHAHHAGDETDAIVAGSGTFSTSTGTWSKLTACRWS